MRRIGRIDRSIGLLSPRTHARLRSPYLCAACRIKTSSFTTSSLRTARETTRTDRLRQRIWGTDTPPGLEDPYGDGSHLAKTKEKGSQKKEVEVQKEEVNEPIDAKFTAPHMDSSYEPAETWDGLEEVGEYVPEDFEHPYKSFVPAEVATNDDLVTFALHQAMVEVFTAKQAKKSLSIVSRAKLINYETGEVQMAPSRKGVDLQFPTNFSSKQIIQLFSPTETVGKGARTQSEEDVAADRSNIDPLQPRTVRDQIDDTITKEAPTESEEDVAADRSDIDPLQSGPEQIDETTTKEAPTESEEDVAADRSTVDPLKHNALRSVASAIASWDPSWLQISLEDPKVKFAVLKRTLQLTGIQIPDSAITSTNTAKAILSQLITPPKPRILVDALTQKDDLVDLPNVHVYPRKQTQVDRERSVGRWKVIEKELVERGLPVAGHLGTVY